MIRDSVLDKDSSSQKHLELRMRECEEKITKVENESKNVILELSDEGNQLFAFFVKNGELKLDIEAKVEGGRGEIYVFAKEGDEKIEVKSRILASNVYLDIHLMAIEAKDEKVKMEGEIIIEKGIKGVEAHLMEEIVLLEGAKHSGLKPILNVQSPDVKASHGAKIHKINSEDLFYLESKGLDEKSAQELVLQGLSQRFISFCERLND